jgi:MFS family permease
MSFYKKISSNYFAVSGNKDFWIFSTGQIISNFGSAISELILPLLVLDITGSAFQVAVVAAIKIVPYVVLGLPAGAYLDFWDRKKIIKIADLTRFFAYGSIPFAWWLGMVNIYQIYTVSLVSGICMVFHSVAEVSSLPNIVKKEYLVPANSYIYTAFNFVSLLGPSIGGFLYETIGGPNSIFIDALTFLAAFFSLLFVRVSFQNQESVNKMRERPLQVITGGLRYLFSHHALRPMAVIVAASNLITIPYYMYIIVFAKNYLNVSPRVTGLLIGTAYIGGIVGSFIAGSISGKKKFGRIIFFILFLDVAARLVLPFSPNVYVVIPLLALAEGAQAVINVAIIAFRQSIVPDHLLGRVNSVFRTVVFSMQPVGLLIGGTMATQWGAPVALLIAGLVNISILLYAFSVKLYRIERQVLR